MRTLVIMAAKTVNHRENVVVADDAPSLLSAAAKLGQNELFFKHRERYYFDYADRCNVHKRELDAAGLKIHMKGTAAYCGMIPEFALLCSMYDAIPENVAAPIALVRRSILWSDEHTVLEKRHEKENSVGGYSVAGYVVEYVAGETLDTYYQNAKSGMPVMVEEFTALARQLIEVLNRLNERGVGHGDANFGNVMVAENGTLKLIDPLPPTVVDANLSTWLAISDDKVRITNMKSLLRHMNDPDNLIVTLKDKIESRPAVNKSCPRNMNWWKYG